MSMKVFFRQEQSKGVAIETILEMLQNKDIYTELKLYMSFITEHSACLTTVLTSLEATMKPLACTVYNVLQDVRGFLAAERTSFGETDKQEKPTAERGKLSKTFKKVFKAAADKINKHLDQHPAMPFYKAARILQHGSISLNIDEHIIPGLTTEALQEWLMYTNLNQSEIPNPLDLAHFWESMSHRYPDLARIDMDAMWMPVSSVDVERSFSQYKHILNDIR